MPKAFVTCQEGSWEQSLLQVPAGALRLALLINQAGAELALEFGTPDGWHQT